MQLQWIMHIVLKVAGFQIVNHTEAIYSGIYAGRLKINRRVTQTRGKLKQEWVCKLPVAIVCIKYTI